MNRKILFRGKRTDNDEWIYGGWAQRHNDNAEYIVTSTVGASCESEINNMIATGFRVKPDTIGKYTGLTDKNGEKIFEGDIIKYKGEFLEVRYSEKQARFLTVFLNGVYDPNPTVTMAKGKVIGNIHDARKEAEKALEKQKENKGK